MSDMPASEERPIEGLARALRLVGAHAYAASQYRNGCTKHTKTADCWREIALEAELALRAAGQATFGPR